MIWSWDILRWDRTVCKSIVNFIKYFSEISMLQKEKNLVYTSVLYYTSVVYFEHF